MAGWELGSHFQPILSLSHRRVIGHEALMRATDATGKLVSPLAVLDHAQEAGMIEALDCASRYLHMRNHCLLADGSRWLFLNMHPAVFVSITTGCSGEAFRRQLQDLGYGSGQVVVEVLEQSVSDTERFGEAVACLRECGCLIALDDFGAGHSNFDRVWRIKPDIVKLDRSFALQCAAQPSARRLLPQIVALLHEAGALVLLEGVETEGQAVLAMEADIDMVQGYFFGRPAPLPVSPDEPPDLIDGVWTLFESNLAAESERHRTRIAPYINALGYAAALVALDHPMPAACRGFLELAGADRCYLLDKNGTQVGPSLLGPAAGEAGRGYHVFDNAERARWAHRPYFRRAAAHPDRVQVTRPYLSIATARLCVTLSVGFRSQRESLTVLCGDVRWD